MGRPVSAWPGLSLFSAIALWKKSCADGGDRAADLGAEGPRGGGERSSPLIKVSGTERSVGGPGQAPWNSEMCFLDENPRQLCEPTQCLFGS